MPTWSNELPKIEKHMGYDLRRTPAVAALQAIITCEDITVCDTHYWGGRTVPCERSQKMPDGSTAAGNCPACNESMPYRTHVYVSAFDVKTREHFIFECTSHAAKPLADYRSSAGTLRGCIFHASRPKGAKNSKVVIETNTANLSRNQIPDPPDMILALSTIWRLPITALREDKERFRPKRIRTEKAGLDRMRNQPDNQPDPPTMREILSGNGDLGQQECLK